MVRGWSNIPEVGFIRIGRLKLRRTSQAVQERRHILSLHILIRAKLGLTITSRPAFRYSRIVKPANIRRMRCSRIDIQKRPDGLSAG